MILYQFVEYCIPFGPALQTFEPLTATICHHYEKYIRASCILELYKSGGSQRTIISSIGSSRQIVSKIIKRAKEKEITVLTDEMTNAWLKSEMFPSQTPKGRGFVEEDSRYVHTELKKKHMTLRLLHKEYERRAADAQRLAYSYRIYCQHYNNYARTYRLTLPIKRKPGELLEVNWAERHCI